MRAAAARHVVCSGSSGRPSRVGPRLGRVDRKIRKCSAAAGVSACSIGEIWRAGGGGWGQGVGVGEGVGEGVVWVPPYPSMSYQMGSVQKS